MGSLNKYFKDQEPYIKCHKGCAKCCKNGDYPFSEIEFILLKLGFMKLDDNTKNIILNKISTILENKKNNTKENFTYECPFLINDICSVYAHRGIICRTFGLISQKEGDKLQMPFCAYDNLNYSNILDKKTGMLSREKMASLNISTEPIAYPIHYSYLTSDKMAEEFQFEFGKKSSLIEFIENDDFFKKQS